MAKKTVEPSTGILLAPLGLVTCQKKGERANIITVAWIGVVNSAPPMISISIRPERYSHKIIKETGEFVANLPNIAILKEMDYCGVASGSKVDKFVETKLTPMDAEKVRVPMIRECPINLECRVKETLSLGSHDLFLGEIVAMHVDEEIQNEEGKIDVLKANPIAYSPGAREYWSLKERVGKHSFTRGKLSA